MRAAYSSPEISSQGGRHILRFELEKRWSSGGSVCASYQVFDSGTGALLVEGDRTALRDGSAGGETERVELPLTLPPEAGAYRIYASPMTEGEAWAYERGLPFILAEVTVSGEQQVRVDRLRVTDLAAIRRRAIWWSVPRAILLPFRTVWRNRRLSYTLTRREILSRSRGSFGGSLWTILNPLLLMATYFFVFGLVLKSRFENDPSPVSFALYFLAGMLPWLAFSEAAGRAPTVLVEYRQLIRKLVFPIEMLPVNLVCSGLVGEAFGLALFMVALLLIRGHLPWTLVYLPVLLIPQMIFTVGFCWFMSALGAFLRDLGQVNGFLMTIWFFVTPICYPPSQVPAGLRPLLTRNPMFILVNGYRDILLQNHAPAWRPLAELTLGSLVLAILSHTWFHRLKKSFADVL